MDTMKMQDKEAVLSIKDVSVAYGEKEVVHDINLDVMHSETFGLIGLNGVGKTTLIKTVLGLRDHNDGEIYIDGRSRLTKESKKKVAYLPERFEPPWFLSGLEFLKFSVSFYDVPFDRELAIAGAEDLALDPDVLKHKVQTYSKGMRQKLGILATVMTRCELLILDEPMSGLDPKARTLVKDLLGHVRQEGRAIFLSSHILADMNEICDRVSVLSNGTLVFTGTPESLRDEGQNDSLERAFLNIIEPDMKAA